jgi:ATP-binding cassette, subfamily B, bacterial PglK
MRYRSTYEAFGGIKELKVNNRENYFLNNYSRASLRHAHYNVWAETIGRLPRSALEVIAFGGIILSTLVLLLTLEDARQVIPIIGLFAFAGFRLMPAMQEAFYCLISIRYYRSTLRKIHHDLVIGLPDQHLKAIVVSASPKPLKFQDSIRLDKVTFNYPNTSYPVFHDINITIKYNTSIAFVGPTGAGKTTLVDIILGLLIPQVGSMHVDNQLINEMNLKNWQANLGYVPQQIYLSDDTIKRNIAFGIDDKDIDPAAIEQASRLANIQNFILSELPNGFNTVIGERGIRLSGGQRQRIGIARALYHDPELLVFDEATSALDGITEEAILVAMQGIAKLKTLIIIAHRLTTVRDCDMIYMLDKGSIIASGTYEELLKSNEQFKAMAKVQ